MVTSSWIYDAIIYTYALSLLFYFSDVMDVNRRAKRIGTGLLVLVWTIETVFLITRIIRHQSGEMFSSFEFMFMFAWLLITMSLVINRFFQIEFIVFIVNLIGFILLLINMLNDPTAPSSMGEWEMLRNLLVFHVGLAACGFASFTLSAVYSGMYLFLHRRLKRRKWSDAVRRLPSLDRIERASYIAITIGIPLFLLSLSVAVSAVWIGNRSELLLDFKVWFTILVVFMYGGYLLWRKSFAGIQLAYYNMICYAIMLLNYGLNSISTFHRWMGV